MTLKRKLKTISILLTLAMLLTLWPGGALAEEDTTPPVLQSAEVTDSGDVELTFDQAMADPSGNEEKFNVRSSFGVLRTVSAVQLKGGDSTKIELILESKIKGGEEFDVSYDGGTIQAAVGGGLLGKIQFFSITNDLPHPDLEPHVFEDFVIDEPITEIDFRDFASGGTPPYSVSKWSGNLPYGLTFNSGKVSGTPNTNTGTWSFKIKVTDSNFAIDIQEYSMTVIEAPSEPDDVTVASVVVAGEAAVVDASDSKLYWLELPYGVIADLTAADVVVTPTNPNAVAGTPATSDNETWTVEVTAEDGVTTATYTISIHDTTAPAFITGYPKTGTVEPDGSKKVNIDLQISEEADFYGVITSSATAPTKLQIEQAYDHTGADALASAGFMLTADSVGTWGVISLPADGTTYYAHMFLRDGAANESGVITFLIASPPAPAQNVCEIDGTGYPSLGAALTAVTDATPTTIKLLQNIENGGIDIEGKNITFDLNGFDLNVTNDSGTGLAVTTGSVSVSGTGEFNVTGTRFGVYADTSTVTVTNVTATDSEGRGVWAYAGTINVNGNVTSNFKGAEAVNGGIVNITGNCSSTGAGAHASGTGSAITINGDASSTDKDGFGVMADSNARVTVNNAIATGANSFGAKAIAWGTVTINGNAEGVGCGVFAFNQAVINVTGDVSGTGDGSFGAKADNAGKITVDGTVRGANFIQVGIQTKTAADKKEPTTKNGYCTYTDETSTVWVKDTAGSVPDLPTITGVSIIGTAKFGSMLVTTGITFSEQISEPTLAYQWKRDGVDIPGAVSSSYTLVQDDIGKTITVTVTASGTATGSVTSAPTAAVQKADGPAAPESPPTLEGKTHNSVTLTADPNYQFSKDGGKTWQDNNVFTGLSPSTEYAFVTRVKETATQNASAPSAVLHVTTDAKSSGGGGGGSSKKEEEVVVVEEPEVPQAPAAVIVLTPNSSTVLVNGQETILDAQPFINPETGRAMVPLRFVSEQLGAYVEWLPDTRQVKITLGDITIILTIGSNQVLVNGVPVEIDAPAEIVNGRTYVPLRFVSETLGAAAEWDEVSRKITITK